MIEVKYCWNQQWKTINIPVHGSKSGCCVCQKLLFNQSQVRSSSSEVLFINSTVLPPYVLYCTYSCHQNCHQLRSRSYHYLGSLCNVELGVCS